MFFRCLRLFAFTCLACYFALLGVLYLRQDLLMYPGALPETGRPVLESGIREDLRKAGFEIWDSSEEPYQGFKKIHPKARANWVFFYGNGDNALGYTAWNQTLEKAFPNRFWNFYVLEYPGYGFRGGKANQKTLSLAAERALKSLQRPDLPLFLVGQSLGSGVSVQAAVQARPQPQALLLITPFTSMSDAARLFLWKALRFPAFIIPSGLTRDTWDSSIAIRHYHGRTAIVAAEDDTITPAWMAGKLYEGMNEPRKLVIQPSTNHWIDWDKLENSREFWEFVWPSTDGS